MSPSAVRAQVTSSDAAAAAQLKQVTPASRLVRVKTVTSAAELATGFDNPLTCDSDGNLYLQTENLGVSGIRKLNLNGQKVALFRPTANPDLQKIDFVGYFALGKSGELYQLTFPHEISRYVVAYKSDGGYKSTIKLQPGFAWMPSALAVFPSGDLLVAGEKYDREHMDGVKLPVTAIFSPEGKLLKEVELKDDQTLYQMAVNGDSRVSAPTYASANLGVSQSQMEAGSDGNIYVMRWVSPAIFYAISAGGNVVRRFTVDPGAGDYRPVEMHIAGNRIAVLFFEPQTMEEVMKVVSLEGEEVATFQLDERPQYGTLGLAFACYTENDSSRFTFLTTGDGDKLELRIAEPR